MLHTQNKLMPSIRYFKLWLSSLVSFWSSPLNHDEDIYTPGAVRIAAIDGWVYS